MMTICEAISRLDLGIYLYLTGLVFWFGACMGSFLNVCIYRIPREESVISPGSHCPHCNKAIRWYNNIPLVSFTVLRARCRDCQGRISPRYVIVETLIALLFVLVWMKAGPSPVLGMDSIYSFAVIPIFWLAVFGLALGTFVDLEHMIIPDRVSLGGIVLGLLFSTLVPALQGQPDAYGGFISSLLGASIGVGLLWGVAILGKLVFRKDAMGMGDVKLMGAIGAFLGWPAVVFTLMLSSFLGAIFGVSMILAGKKEMQSRIPFGPYIAVAALIWMLWGPVLLRAYLNWLIPQ